MRFCHRGSSLAMRQTVDIGGQQPDTVASQPFPRGHLAVPPVDNGLSHLSGGTSVQPDVIGQIWRANRLVAAAIRTMTGRAQDESGFACGDLIRSPGSSAQAQYVSQRVLDSLIAERSAKGRHDALPPVRDRLYDRVGATAVEPVV